MIRVLIAESKKLLEESLKIALDQESNFQVLTPITAADELLTQMKDAAPDVLLLDYDLLKARAPNLIQMLSRQYPQCKIVITHLDLAQPVHRTLVEAGVGGFLPVAQTSLQMLFDCLQQVYEGKTNLYLTDSEASRFGRDWLRRRKVRLPARQMETLTLFAQAKSLEQIADEMGVAVPTVRSHLRGAYKAFSLEKRKNLTYLTQLRQLVQRYSLDELLSGKFSQ